MAHMNAVSTIMVGNLASEPEMRTVSDGIPVANFRLACSDRRLDNETGEWVDTNTVFMKVSCWRAMARNVVASLRKGDPVVVFGRIQSYSYVRDEQQRTGLELDAYAIGPNLARGFAIFHRVHAPVGQTAGEVPALPTPEQAEESAAEVTAIAA